MVSSPVWRVSQEFYHAAPFAWFYFEHQKNKTLSGLIAVYQFLKY